MSFAPYVMKYLKIIVKGACLVENVEIVEYKHPQVTNRICLPENDRELQTICKAALENYKANSLDVFMDCPSRERGGWLCDSYFTSAVERILTGESILEHAFWRILFLRINLHIYRKECCLCVILLIIIMEIIFQTGECGLL